MSGTTSFVCSQCGNIDDIHATHQLGGDYTCHRCLTGSWHGLFEEVKEGEDPDQGPMLNRVNYEEGPDFQ